MPSNYANEHVPSGEATDNSYVSRNKGEPIGVQADDAPVEDLIDDKAADTDEQLGKKPYTTDSHIC